MSTTEDEPLLASRRSKASRVGALALGALALAVVYNSAAADSRDTAASFEASGPPNVYPFTPAPEGAKEQFEKELLKIAKKSSKKSKKGCAGNLGFSRSDLRVTGAGGKNGGPDKNSVTIEDKFAGGSLVKPLTAATIMRFQQDGKLSIDDKFLPYVDKYVAFMADRSDWKYSWKSLVELFGEKHRPLLESLTIKTLLSMQAPFADIDITPDLENQLWALPDPGYMGPFELLDLPVVKDNFPWKGYSDGWGLYSTTTYIILGLLIAGQQTPMVPPDKVDQGIYLSADVKKQLAFGNDGSPVKDFSPVHPIDDKGRDWWPKAGPMVGFTGSDIMGSGQAFADMFLDIYGPDAAVTNLSSVMATVLTGDTYGIGTELDAGRYGEATEFPCGYGELYGHGGSTYGAVSLFVYSPKLQAAFGGSNNGHCGDYHKELCLVYAAAIEAIDGVVLDCNKPGKKIDCDNPKKKKSDSASAPSLFAAATAVAAIAVGEFLYSLL